jgi:hypothetical protein
VQSQAVQEHLVEQPHHLGQVQADELRIKKQGGLVWMALAMMVHTRLWRAGGRGEPPPRHDAYSPPYRARAPLRRPWPAVVVY